MPGIDFKQMWSGLRPRLEAIWNNDWLDGLYELVHRGLVASGILSPALTKGPLGFLWATLVWIAMLPLVTIASFVGFLLVFPFSLAWGVWRLVAWPFTGRWSDLRTPVASRIAEISDSLRAFSQQTWRQRVLSVLKSIGIDLLNAGAGFAILFAFICMIWIGIFLWWGAILASSHLFGYGFFNGRDDASAGINSFTTVCNYRNLTQRDMISMTFDTSAARDAFSCPPFKRMGGEKK